MMKGIARLSLMIAVAVSLSACSVGDDTVFTLYRNSVLDANMRVHVATFDSADGVDYNNGNCAAAVGLFQNQNGVSIKYWCEKGRFKS